MKKTIVMGISMLMVLGLIGSIQNARAAWTPGAKELGPTKDTYVSLGGALAEPLSNFGMASTLDVGKGFKGVCVTAIQFNLSTLPANVESLNFSSAITVYGSNTRHIKVSILVGVDWDELQVTGLENPFNASELWVSDEGNLTSVLVGGSTTSITIELADYIGQRGLITLLFAPEVTDESWITLSAKENPYLYSSSNPPHLIYSIPPADDPGPSGSSGVIIGVGLVIGVIVIVVLKKKKAKT
jgi:hypothetical protein